MGLRQARRSVSREAASRGVSSFLGGDRSSNHSFGGSCGAVAAVASDRSSSSNGWDASSDASSSSSASGDRRDDPRRRPGRAGAGAGAGRRRRAAGRPGGAAAGAGAAAPRSGPELPRGRADLRARRAAEAVARRHAFDRGVGRELRGRGVDGGARVALSRTNRGCAASGGPHRPRSRSEMLGVPPEARRAPSSFFPLGVSGCKCSSGSCRHESASSPSLPAYNRRASLCDGLRTMKSSLWSGSDRSAPLLGTRALRGRGTTPRNPAKSAAALGVVAAHRNGFRPEESRTFVVRQKRFGREVELLASSALFWESASTRWCEVTAPPAIAAASAYAPSSVVRSRPRRVVASPFATETRRLPHMAPRVRPLQRTRGSRALDGRSPVHLPRLVSRASQTRARRDLKQL